MQERLSRKEKFVVAILLVYMLVMVTAINTALEAVFDNWIYMVLAYIPCGMLLGLSFWKLTLWLTEWARPSR